MVAHIGAICREDLEANETELQAAKERVCSLLLRMDVKDRF